MLFYGAMFVAMEDSADSELAAFQVEFERALLGAPPWAPAAHVRSVAGWNLGWGERLV